jgi:hypothetical protein
MLSILHAGRSERTNVAAAGMVHLRTVRARSDPGRPRFQVLLPQLPKSEASGLTKLRHIGDLNLQKLERALLRTGLLLDDKSRL